MTKLAISEPHRRGTVRGPGGAAELRPAAAARRARTGRRGWRDRFLGPLFILPAFVLIAVLFLSPIGMTAWISFNNWPLFGHHHFIGFANYRALGSNTIFLHALLFTVYFVLGTGFVTLVVALGLALLVYRKRRGVGLIRLSFLIPIVIGFIPASYIWFWLYTTRVGIYDQLLRMLGLPGGNTQWLNSALLSTVSVGIMTVWKTAGFSMILLMSGMQGIPTELHEAARLDGASGPRLFWHVVLPLMRRAISLTVVLITIGCFLSFDQFFVLTSGGPANATTTIVFEIYKTAFANFNLGGGAAESMVAMVLLAAISAVQLRILRPDPMDAS